MALRSLKINCEIFQNYQKVGRKYLLANFKYKNQFIFNSKISRAQQKFLTPANCASFALSIHTIDCFLTCVWPEVRNVILRQGKPIFKLWNF